MTFCLVGWIFLRGGWGKNLEKVGGLLLWSPVPVSRLSIFIF